MVLLVASSFGPHLISVICFLVYFLSYLFPPSLLSFLPVFLSFFLSYLFPSFFLFSPSFPSSFLISLYTRFYLFSVLLYFSSFFFPNLKCLFSLFFIFISSISINIARVFKCYHIPLKQFTWRCFAGMGKYQDS